MARLLTQAEKDIFCAEFPEFCDKFHTPGLQIDALYKDGWVKMSRGLGFPVMVYAKNDGTILHMDVSEEFPGGVRQDIPAPPGLADELAARAAAFFKLIRNAIIFLGIVFVAFVIWDLSRKRD
jgi:hypothetical protein